MFLQLPLEIEEKIWRMTHEMLLSECLKDDIWVDVFYYNRYHYFQFSNGSKLCYSIGTRYKEYKYIENNYS